ncbi:C40 family peptidase [Gelidibacter salicanalis]|uniref:C40 family peptidase n=1 Tax=Gelidibacter salicanalis TaxID=291193 RepID=A0A934KP75_9FLAO|nr:SH3 domain-containing C40 family peptidase [Gelidibacter salicanalis]MBJ7882951.1 C40 family peptidase [Gelidibacter salicanalis]
MIQKISKIGVLFLALTLAMSCATRVENKTHLTKEIEAVKSQYAPDKRVALFDVTAEKRGKVYMLKGESNLPDAVEALKNNLTAAKIDYIDSIQILPASALEGKTLGLVTISVANLRSRPAHSAELATQATLGTPVKILKKENSWTLIQTPDKYLAWVDSGGVEDIDQAEFDRWKSATKLIYTTISGSSYSMPFTASQVVSDVVAGGIFELLSEEGEFYKVVYPDQRIAYINKTEAELYASWLSRTDPSQENLVATSKRLMGLPYLWGGTSPKGVDCSGFTKTIFFLNGLILPRDASQQIHTGDLIDDNQNFEKLQPGDLLFFGKKATETSPERVIHVGMWIGNNEFIHSAGRVKINSVDKNAANFDAYNLNRYLRTKRVAKSDIGEVINMTETAVFEVSKAQ